MKLSSPGTARAIRTSLPSRPRRSPSTGRPTTSIQAGRRRRSRPAERHAGPQCWRTSRALIAQSPGAQELTLYLSHDKCRPYPGPIDAVRLRRRARSAAARGIPLHPRVPLVRLLPRIAGAGLGLAIVTRRTLAGADRRSQRSLRRCEGVDTAVLPLWQHNLYGLLGIHSAPRRIRGRRCRPACSGHEREGQGGAMATKRNDPTTARSAGYA